MNGHFTNNYKIVTKLVDVPFDVSVKHNDSSRWICYTYKECIGLKGFEITMIDNYLESYTVIWSGSGTKEFTTISGKVSINSDPYYGITIICKPDYTDLVSLPDFAIDVLQTVQEPSLYEVLRRVAVAYHEKINQPNKMNVFDSNVMYYPFGLL